MGIAGLRQPGRDLKGEESQDTIDMGELCLKGEGILQVLAYSCVSRIRLRYYHGSGERLNRTGTVAARQIPALT